MFDIEIGVAGGFLMVNLVCIVLILISYGKLLGAKYKNLSGCNV
jgi:hypothetical protein